MTVVKIGDVAVENENEEQLILLVKAIQERLRPGVRSDSIAFKDRLIAVGNSLFDALQISHEDLRLEIEVQSSSVMWTAYGRRGSLFERVANKLGFPRCFVMGPPEPIPYEPSGWDELPLGEW